MNPAERLERSQWDLFWLPPDVRVRDRPELLVLSCNRPLPHLNIALRTRAGADELPALIMEGRAFMNSAQCRWLVTDTWDSAPLADALGRADFAPRFHYDARAMPPTAYEPRPAPDVDVRPVADLSGMRDQARVMSLAFDRPFTETDEELAADLPQCTGPDARVRRFVAYRGETPVSQAAMTWYPDLRFVFLWAGGTVPDARGHGLYSALVGARMELAGALGAEWVGLYARTDTSSPIVAAQGFERFGAMTYYWPSAMARSS